jgi:hypothetical protein
LPAGSWKRDEDLTQFAIIDRITTIRERERQDIRGCIDSSKATV